MSTSPAVLWPSLLSRPPSHPHRCRQLQFLASNTHVFRSTSGRGLRWASAAFSTTVSSSKSSRSMTPSGAEFFGQPLPITHPHLLKPDEITIGITAKEYADRRARLMDSLEDGAVVILAGARTKWMAHHVFYPFRQSSDFWYLSGFQEPDSCLVLEKDNTRKGHSLTMFVRPKDPAQEMWEGARTGMEGVVRWFGADQAFDISQLAQKLKPLLTKSTTAPLYLDLPTDIEFPAVPQWRQSVPLLDFFSTNNSQTGDLIGALTSGPSISNSDLDACLAVLATARSSRGQFRAARPSKFRPIRSLQAKLDPLKMIKSAAELRLLRIAADVSAHGFKAAMRFAAEADPEKLRGEHGLVQAFEAACHQSSPSHGGRMGYVPVCAAGRAALTIHYTFNDRAFDPGQQMVLLDAGFEYAGYVADITRTFPVGAGGKYSSAQRDLYQMVKGVETDLIGRCQQSSGESLSTLHRASCELLKDGLKQLGFSLKNPEALQRLYPHYIGHPVGTDLHDTPSWNRGSRLKAGSVITIEPGVYVPDEDQYPAHFRGMGIRVEDMVHVRDNDHVVLSCNTPKEVADVEACGSGLLDGVRAT